MLDVATHSVPKVRLEPFYAIYANLREAGTCFELAIIADARMSRVMLNATIKTNAG
jgi:hypothetical protein